MAVFRNNCWSVIILVFFFLLAATWMLPRNAFVEDIIPVEGNISSLVSITHDYKSKDVNHDKELEELIPVIPYTTYNDDYKCMKDK